MKHVKGLDTLRAFAVFFVIIAHNGVWFDDTVTNGRFIRYVVIPDGSFGVHLFFVLSGFLITSILLKEKLNARTGARAGIVKNFFIRRSLRIFPAYYLLLFFLYKIDYQCVRRDFPYYVSYMGNVLCYIKNAWTCFCHSWSLSVEEQFYLLWPWLILYVNLKYLRYVFYSAIAIGVGTTFYAIAVTHHIAPLLVFNCFDAFGIGGLYAYAMLDGKRMASFSKALRIALPLSLIGFYYLRCAIFMNAANDSCLFLAKTFNCIISVWLIRLVMNTRSGFFHRYLLENKLLNFLGRISYGIYLYHFIYNGVCYDRLNEGIKRIFAGLPSVRDTLLDHHLNYLLQIGMVILIAWLSYTLIEKPFLRLKKFFEYKEGNMQDAS